MYDTEAEDAPRLTRFRETTSPGAANKAAPELAVLGQRNHEALERTASAIARLRSGIERLRGGWPEETTGQIGSRPGGVGVGDGGALSMLRTQVERAQTHAEMLERLASLLDGAV